MKDWLVVCTADNWKICAREGLLGLGHRGASKLSRMSEGDRIWVYVSTAFVGRQYPKVRQIQALVRVTGPVEHLQHPPWKARGSERFAVARPIKAERTLDIPGDFLSRLSFARGRAMWGPPLLNAPLLLTPADVAKLTAYRRREVHNLP